MHRAVMALAAGLAVALAATVSAPEPSLAQQSSAKTAAATPKPGKGEKVCRVKLKYSGETRTWICKTEEPCCVWHEINYVKCGSTITGCL